MASRLDFSMIEPLGAYAAKQCPVRTQLDVLRPAEPAEPPPFDVFLHEAGNAFEESLVASWTAGVPGGWVLVGATSRLERETQTTRAMDDQAPVIIGGRLPTDEGGRRVGEPDLLVWDRDGYVSVDIKHHRTIDPERSGATLFASTLDDPFPQSATALSGELVKHRSDALQLAHYAAMLRAIDRAASHNMGGIIGKEGVVVWYDLAAPMWTTPAKSDGLKQKRRSTREIYDFEFGFRRDIAATAMMHLQDGSVPLLVEPMRSGQCRGCPWRDHCGPQLDAAPGDTSLLPKVSYPQWRALRNLRIRNRSDVLRLDYPTAELLAAGLEVSDWLDRAEASSPHTPVSDLRPRARTQLETLARHGIGTAGDLLTTLDRDTASLWGRWPQEAILSAHAALAPASVYRRPGVDRIEVPRADIELDIDMENTFDGVYLWGVLVTDRSGTGLVTPGYRSFHSWQPMSETTERSVFDEFWHWLSKIRANAAGAEATLSSYVWHEPAENAQLKRVTFRDPARRTEVEALIDSASWIDLRRVFMDQLTTGSGTGLKAIAPLAGFAWEVADPGGAMSMVYHGYATGDHPETASRYRRWLLDYNRGDVLATAAIREWMDSTTFPGLDLPQLPAV